MSEVVPSETVRDVCRGRHEPLAPQEVCATLSSIKCLSRQACMVAPIHRIPVPAPVSASPQAEDLRCLSRWCPSACLIWSWSGLRRS